MIDGEASWEVVVVEGAGSAANLPYHENQIVRLAGTVGSLIGHYDYKAFAGKFVRLQLIVGAVHTRATSEE